MKKSSFIFNVVIAIAVVVLYILHFASTQKKTTTQDGNDPIENFVNTPSNNKAISIAYVNTDSVLLGYDNYNLKKNDLESQQSNAEFQYEKKMREFEKKYKSYTVMVQRGVITEEKATQELAEMQKNIEQYKRSATENLLRQNEELIEETYNSIIDVVKSHNNSAGYTYIFSKNGAILLGPNAFDISDIILQELNK